MGAGPKTMTLEEWKTKGRELFGDDQCEWKFKCPVCGYVASVKDWKDAGATEGMVAFSCIGRLQDKCRDAFEGKGSGPCSYAGGGFFKLNPIMVIDPDGNEHQMFEFADKN